MSKLLRWCTDIYSARKGGQSNQTNRFAPAPLCDSPFAGVRIVDGDSFHCKVKFMALWRKIVHHVDVNGQVVWWEFL